MIARPEWIEQPEGTPFNLGSVCHIFAYLHVNRGTMQYIGERNYWVMTNHVSSQGILSVPRAVAQTRAIFNIFPFERISLDLPIGFPELFDYSVCYVRALNLTPNEKVSFREEFANVKFKIPIID